MPTPEQITSVYDFENILEAAFVQTFIARGIESVYCRATNVNFQETRPRLEIKVDVAQGTNQAFGFIEPPAVGAFNRGYNKTFVGKLTIRAITDGGQENKLAHSQYHSMVRFVCANLGQHVNDHGGLIFHKVQSPVRPVDCDFGIKTTDGYIYSVETLDFDFSIQDEAFISLQN